MKNSYLLLFFISTLLFSCGDDDDDNNDSSPDDQAGNVTNDISQQFVNAHNLLRSEVGVADIEWSEELAESSQAWADQLESSCQLVHSTSEFGENLWGGTSGFFTIEQVVESWGEEKEFYNVEDNECVGGVCGHYTQIVWENSTKVGCGMITCDGFDIWVCQYDPPGNIVGERPFQN